MGLFISLPFASGAIYLMGESGRAQTFLPSVILFFLLSLPFILFFKLPYANEDKQKINLFLEYKNQWAKFKDLIKDRNMKIFLISYFFFNDAIITASNNFPIFLQSVYNVSDKVKSMILLGILVTSVFGALFSGWVSACRFGNVPLQDCGGFYGIFCCCRALSCF